MRGRTPAVIRLYCGIYSQCPDLANSATPLRSLILWLTCERAIVDRGGRSNMSSRCLLPGAQQVWLRKRLEFKALEVVCRVMVSILAGVSYLTGVCQTIHVLLGVIYRQGLR